VGQRSIRKTHACAASARPLRCCLEMHGMLRWPHHGAWASHSGPPLPGPSARNAHDIMLMLSHGEDACHAGTCTYAEVSSATLAEAPTPSKRARPSPHSCLRKATSTTQPPSLHSRLRCTAASAAQPPRHSRLRRMRAILYPSSSFSRLCSLPSELSPLRPSG